MVEGGKGGSRSRFTENKTVLSQFPKNLVPFRCQSSVLLNLLHNGSTWVNVGKGVEVWGIEGVLGTDHYSSGGGGG